MGRCLTLSATHVCGAGVSYKLADKVNSTLYSDVASPEVSKQLEPTAAHCRTLLQGTLCVVPPLCCGGPWAVRSTLHCCGVVLCAVLCCAVL